MYGQIPGLSYNFEISIYKNSHLLLSSEIPELLLSTYKKLNNVFVSTSQPARQPFVKKAVTKRHDLIKTISSTTEDEQFQKLQVHIRSFTKFVYDSVGAHYFKVVRYTLVCCIPFDLISLFLVFID